MPEPLTLNRLQLSVITLQNLLTLEKYLPGDLFQKQDVSLENSIDWPFGFI